MLNTVALWDKPAVSPTVTVRDKSAIRTDWRTERRSAYNHRATALAAYRKLLETIEARHILTSYSTDGTIPLPALLAAAAERGHLDCVWNAYKRYRVSAQRRSRKPLNIEFVLIVDTTALSSLRCRTHPGTADPDGGGVAGGPPGGRPRLSALAPTPAFRL